MGMENGHSDQVDDEFIDHLELLLVQCVVRLEDGNSDVSVAALRCLQELSPVILREPPKVEQAAELLSRREDVSVEFDAFIFPFVALVHREAEPTLVAQRLEICRS